MKLRQLSKRRYSLINKRPRIVSYRPKYNLRRIMWEINPYDSDKNENWSIPHGDDIYPTRHTLKLNVYTGEIIQIDTRTTHGWLSKKELRRLHSDKHFQRVVEQATNNSSQQIYSKNLCDSFIFESVYIVFKGTKNRRNINVKNSRYN